MTIVHETGSWAGFHGTHGRPDEGIESPRVQGGHLSRTGHYQFSHTVANREAGFKRSSAAPDEKARHFPSRGG
jgi:hypothetical protein